MATEIPEGWASWKAQGILPITAVNKNQVPYAVHPDPHPAECAEANTQ
jgi:hypothetical protein